MSERGIHGEAVGLGALLGLAQKEPEAADPIERTVNKLSQGVAGATKAGKEHLQNAKDYQVIIDYMKNAPKDDPLAQAMSRVFV